MHIAKLLPLVALLALPASGAPRPPLPPPGDVALGANVAAAGRLPLLGGVLGPLLGAPGIPRPPHHRRQLDATVSDVLDGVGQLVDEVLGAQGPATPSRRQLDTALDELLHGLQQLLDDLLGEANDAAGATATTLRRQLSTDPSEAGAILAATLRALEQAIDGLAHALVGIVPTDDGVGSPLRRQLDTTLSDAVHDIDAVRNDLLGHHAQLGGKNPHRRQLDIALSDLLNDIDVGLADLIGSEPRLGGAHNPHRRQLDITVSDLLHALDTALDNLIGSDAHLGGVQNPQRRQIDTTVSDLLHALDAALDDLLGSHSPSGGLQNPDRRQLDIVVNELLANLRKALNDLLTGQEATSSAGGASALAGSGASPLRRRQLGATHADIDVLDVLHTCLSAGIGRRQLLEVGAEAHVLDLLHVCLGLSLGHRDAQDTASTPHRRQGADLDLDLDVDVALDLNLKKRQLGPLPIDGLGKLPISGLPIDKLPIGKPPVPHTPSLPAVPSLPGKLPLGLPRLPANLPGLSGIPVIGGLLRRIASPQPANKRRDPPPPPPPSAGIKVDLLAAIDDIVAGHLHADAAGKQATPPSPGRRRHTARQLLDLDANLGLDIGLVPPPPPPAEDRRQLVNLDLDLNIEAPACDTPEFTAQLATLAGTLNANGAGNFGTLVLTALAATPAGCAFVFPLVREARTLLAPQDSACGPALVAELTAHPELLLLYFSPARELHSTDFIVGGPTPEAVVPLASAELVEYWRDAAGALWLQILGTGIQAAVLEADIATATGTAIILENAWGLEVTAA